MNTTYFLNTIAGNVFKSQTTPALPARFYVGFSSTTPNLNGTGVTEPSTAGTGYTRVELTSLTAPSNGMVTNANVIQWPEATAIWGTMTYLVVYDNSSVGAGNLLWYDRTRDTNNDPVNLSINAGTTLSIKANSVSLGVINETP